jgi:hypothetical protein
MSNFESSKRDNDYPWSVTGSGLRMTWRMTQEGLCMRWTLESAGVQQIVLIDGSQPPFFEAA